MPPTRIEVLDAMQETVSAQRAHCDKVNKSSAHYGVELERLLSMQDRLHAALITVVPDR